ncbi:diguanylate cyclase [Desulfopila sp. IMCC35006]|uniref:sensor domain-containing diguanylate cyclase n=1 Tax=Desulfopila sp. IMCC35006 TaxID=2569542 RepID=UPI0010ABE1DF|nr:sensor domain-containing diguanylate cyclase [Desulfopila sp. IMCC35006]TKB25937.1 diguanylate cyclase [Desulfopila sp. IMCC35006]
MVNFSLRSVLIFPYVALVIALAVAIGTLSYFTGGQAVLTVSEHLLRETVSRISQAVDRHVVGSVATLEAAFPNGMLAPVSIESDFINMRTRFWIATSLHIDPNNYVYYGNRSGQAMGLFRHSLDEGELRIKYTPEEHRSIYQIEGIDGEMRSRKIEKQLFDPRQRPWYQAAQTAIHDTWTSVYIDFGTHDLVATRSRKVLNNRQEIEGVVATDMPLRALNDFVSSLKISPNGVAFIFEPDGNLIASSCSPNIRQNNAGENIRVNAGDSGHPLLTEIYQHILPYLSPETEINKPITFFFEGNDKKKIHVALSKFEDGAGLKWINVVALPSEDFMEGIEKNVLRTLLLGVATTILVILVGLRIVHWVTKDLKILSLAVNRVDSGFVEQPIDIRRRDEIGDLAKSFSAMQQRLQTDYLTGLPNRYALEQYLQAAVEHSQGQKKGAPFALLFIDLNDFKLINDRFGHDAGDQALIEISQRLRNHIRKHDFVARYAGDEFIIALNDVQSKNDIAPIRKNIEQALAAPLETFDASPLTLAGAIGEAHFPDDAENAADLLIVADRNMYTHKAAIKSRFAL